MRAKTRKGPCGHPGIASETDACCADCWGVSLKTRPTPCDGTTAIVNFKLEVGRPAQLLLKYC
jgi:hypothetical protein